jgi:NADP-dependent 3-hydroxy acid dehydrogenase YdfG
VKDSILQMTKASEEDILALTADMNNLNDLEHIITSTLERFHKIDVLVSCQLFVFLIVE